MENLVFGLQIFDSLSQFAIGHRSEEYRGLEEAEHGCWIPERVPFAVCCEQGQSICTPLWF
jgi:hypothetical protein